MRVRSSGLVGGSVNRIVSTKYRDGARGQPCTLRIPGVCTGGGEDTVFAHIRDDHTGRSIKASDISGCDACFACHEVFDRRAKAPYVGLLNDMDWLCIALRGLQRTLENRIARGLLFLTQDVVKARHERPTPKRKPPAERKRIPPGPKLTTRSNWPPPGSRKLNSKRTAQGDRE